VKLIKEVIIDMSGPYDEDDESTPAPVNPDELDFGPNGEAE
jgi:hypothetical protein